MSKATEYMVREHEVIRSMLAVLKAIASLLKEGQSVPKEHLEQLLDFLRIYSDRIHHEKEEGILIPALFGHGFHMAGGPMCSYFKDLQMMREDLHSRIREIEARLGGIRLLIPGSEKESVYLGIPDGTLPIIEEHKLGRKLVQAMACSLNDPARLTQTGPGTFVDFATDFLFLLEEHIDKENRCLFPMADNVLTKSEQEKMLRDFEKFDREAFASPDYSVKERQWGELRVIYK